MPTVGHVLVGAFVGVEQRNLVLFVLVLSGIWSGGVGDVRWRLELMLIDFNSLAPVVRRRKRGRDFFFCFVLFCFVGRP